jgi:hypothetical protein
LSSLVELGNSNNLNHVELLIISFSSSRDFRASSINLRNKLVLSDNDNLKRVADTNALEASHDLVLVSEDSRNDNGNISRLESRVLLDGVTLEVGESDDVDDQAEVAEHTKQEESQHVSVREFVRDAVNKQGQSEDDHRVSHLGVFLEERLGVRLDGAENKARCRSQQIVCGVEDVEDHENDRKNVEYKHFLVFSRRTGRSVVLVFFWVRGGWVAVVLFLCCV